MNGAIKKETRDPTLIERLFKEDREHNAYQKVRSVFLAVYVIIGLISMVKLLFSSDPQQRAFSFLPPVGQAVQRALYAPAYYFAEHQMWRSGTLNLLSVILSAAGIVVLGAWALWRAINGSDHVGNSHYASRMILIRTVVMLAVAFFSLDYAIFLQNGSSLLSQLQRFPFEVLASPLVEIRETFNGQPPKWLFGGAAAVLCGGSLVSTFLNVSRLLRNHCFLNSVKGRARLKGSIGNVLLSAASPVGMFLLSLIIWMIMIYLFNLASTASNTLAKAASVIILIAAFVGVGAVWGIAAPISFCRKQKGAYRYVFWMYLLLHFILGIIMLSLTNIYSGHDPLLITISDEAKQTLQQGMHDFEAGLLERTTFSIVETAFAGTGVTMLAGLIGLFYCWLSKCPVCGRYASWEFSRKIGKKLHSYEGTRVTRTHVADHLKTKPGEFFDYTSGIIPEAALKKDTEYDEYRAGDISIIRGKEEYDETTQRFKRDVYATRETRKCRYCGGAANVNDTTTEIETDVGDATTERKEQKAEYMFLR